MMKSFLIVLAICAMGYAATLAVPKPADKPLGDKPSAGNATAGNATMVKPTEDKPKDGMDAVKPGDKAARMLLLSDSLGDNVVSTGSEIVLGAPTRKVVVSSGLYPYLSRVYTTV